MKKSHDLQVDLQQYLLENDQTILPHILSTDNASAEFRLQIYNNTYFLRLQEVLQQDYPALHTLLGDQQFSELCQAYVAQHTSTSYSLRWFGQHMPDFLAQNKHYQQHTLLHEMAKFEWALSTSFDAIDEALTTLKDLAAVAPELWPSLRFEFSSSAQLLAFTHATPQIWQQIANEEPFADLLSQQESSHWLLWRKGLNCEFCSLTSAEHSAFTAMVQGRPFADLCSGLSKWLEEEDIPIYAAGLLKSWILSELVTQIDSQ